MSEATFKKGDLIISKERENVLDVLRILDIEECGRVTLHDNKRYRGADPLETVEKECRHATPWEIFLNDWQYEYMKDHRWGENPYCTYLEDALHILFFKNIESLEEGFPFPLEPNFHSYFRQVGITEDHLDGVIWNLLHEVEAFWVVFERYKKVDSAE